MGEVTPGLRALLANQVCFQVEDWGPSSERPSNSEREQGDLAVAHVVSSAVREHWMVEKPKTEPVTPDPFDELFAGGFVEYEEPKHIVVLDVDHPAHLVDSSTPGHHHLYVEIPPCAWSDYVEFLQAAHTIGLIEEGYLNASIERGHSDVRLPWVRKGEEGDLPTPGGVVSKVAEPVQPAVPLNTVGADVLGTTPF
jgi:hypothetical protein